MSLTQIQAQAVDSVVTAKKYVEYKKSNGHLRTFKAPEIVLICYQQDTLNHLLEYNADIEVSRSLSNLYLVRDGQIGILGGWGIGAPALAIKIEELIALGIKKFIAVGTAGSLMDAHHAGDFVISPWALAEDGVSHLYLPENTNIAEADQQMLIMWNQFTEERSLPIFHSVPSWSFSAFFKETPADIRRVTAQGGGIVEMEAATLYALGQEKNVQTLAVFVISDLVTPEQWIPHLRESVVRTNLRQLADWALQFCKDEIHAGRSTP